MSAKAKLRQEEREREDGEKMIVGALVLKHYEESPQVQDWLERLLDEKLSRTSERVLFGLGKEKNPQG